MEITAEKIKTLIKEAEDRIDVESMKDDVPMVDQGVDSLDFAAIFLQIEEDLGVSVPDEDIAKLRTVNDIVAYVSEKLK